MPFANKECIGSLRGYQSNEKTCIANNVPIDCSKPPLPPRAAAPATTGCRRNIFLDMGANWCNTMQLYKDVPEAAPAAGLAHAGLPWHVFAVEAAPLIAPYVELCTEALAAGRPLPTPLVPPAGSSMQLLKYAKELGCEKAGGRREVLACIAKALDGPLAALGRIANPKLTANMALLRARLDGARTRGGCEAVPRHAGLLSAFSRAPDPSFRADGLATSGGGTYTLLPAAAGASEGVLRMAGSPLQMLRGGTTAAGGSHQPQFDVPTIDVVQWMRASFSEDDFVILKMDVEGAEIGTRAREREACMHGGYARALGRGARAAMRLDRTHRTPRACDRASRLPSPPSLCVSLCRVQTLCPSCWRRTRRVWWTSSYGSATPSGAAQRASASARSGRSTSDARACATSTAKSIPLPRTRRAAPRCGM